MKLRVTLFVGVLLTPFVGGCSYYEITDPSTNKVYYAAPFDLHQSGWNGAVQFRDAATGKIVTIQNSEVRTVSKEDAIIGSGGKIGP